MSENEASGGKYERGSDIEMMVMDMMVMVTKDFAAD